MLISKDQIKQAAMNLEPAEREALAEELLLSIEPAEAQAIDAAWLEEARRRDARFISGQTTAKPATDVIDHLLNKASRDRGDSSAKPKKTLNAHLTITNRSVRD